MKKLLLAFVTVAVVGLGSTPAVAQDDAAPVDCADKPSSDPSDPCYNPAVYPPTTPASSVAPPTNTASPSTSVDPPVPPNNLPQTGSGISSTLGIAALLLLVGGVVVVAARRRSTSSSPAT